MVQKEYSRSICLWLLRLQSIIKDLLEWFLFSTNISGFKNCQSILMYAAAWHGSAPTGNLKPPFLKLNVEYSTLHHCSLMIARCSGCFGDQLWRIQGSNEREYTDLSAWPLVVFFQTDLYLYWFSWFIGANSEVSNFVA